MALNDFEFKSSYNKIDHDIAEEFYLPCMRNAVQYDRITGYFGSAIYVIAWDALKEFIANGGKIRIICSPFISEEDSQALSEGNQARIDEIIQKALMTELQRMIEATYLEKPSRLLACLISSGNIEIKLAIPNEFSHPSIKQLFHDKVGIFRDALGNSVGFRGSLNETYSGLSNSGNVESIDVFQSWDGGKESQRADEAALFFERVWNGETDTTLLCELPPRVKEKIDEMAKDTRWTDLLDEVTADVKKGSKWLPPSKDGKKKKLRDHQFAALEAWVAHGRRGIFEHATGSGKTFTAICAIRDALKRKKSVIVLVPSIGLLEQWENELKSAITDIKVDFLICGTGYTLWRKDGILEAWTAPATKNHTVVVATMDTAAGDKFMGGITQGDHLLLVADEVHRIGSKRRSKCLTIDTGERLGLSATPIRYGDPEGTQAIMDYFGGIVKPVYTLNDAIHDGVLTKYFYYPTTMHLSPLEQEEWNDYTKKINRLYAQLMSSGGDAKQCLSNFRISNLMLQRARLVKTASQKVSLAGDIILRNYKKGQKWIVYCDNQHQLAEVLDLLISKGIDAYEYHSEMTGDKYETLDYFSHFGGVLVSIRCLDEGIDIPSTTHALILASSKNPREFIQRRGRILRKAEGKNFAYLYDVVVTPNGEMQDDTKTVSIIESELSRAIQFGEWAENPSCIAELKNIAIDFGIDVSKSSTDGNEGGDEE